MSSKLGKRLSVTFLNISLHFYINVFESIVHICDLPSNDLLTNNLSFLFIVHFISDCNKGKSKKWKKILAFPHISICLPLKDKIGESRRILGLLTNEWIPIINYKWVPLFEWLFFFFDSIIIIITATIVIMRPYSVWLWREKISTSEKIVFFLRRNIFMAKSMEGVYSLCLHCRSHWALLNFSLDEPLPPFPVFFSWSHSSIFNSIDKFASTLPSSSFQVKANSIDKLTFQLCVNNFHVWFPRFFFLWILQREKEKHSNNSNNNNKQVDESTDMVLLFYL